MVLSCYIYDPQAVIKSSTIVSGLSSFYEKICGTLLDQDSWGCSLNVETNPEPPHSHHPEHLGSARQAGSLYETEWLGDPIIISEKTASRKQSSLRISARWNIMILRILTAALH